MGLDSFRISRHQRTASALAVLGEGGEVAAEAKARLLQVMWEGWREVMRIKFGAAIYSQWQAQKRRQSE